MSIEIRCIGLSDVADIIAFAVKHAPEIPSWGEVVPDILEKSLIAMLTRSNFFMRGAYLDDEFKGGMICEISPTWFNYNYEANGRTIYLHKDVRGKGIAQRLYIEYDEWVKQHTYVQGGGLQTTSGVDITPLVEKLGYVKVGITYRKRY